jgi:hypothetical protein
MAYSRKNRKVNRKANRKNTRVSKKSRKVSRKMNRKSRKMNRKNTRRFFGGFTQMEMEDFAVGASRGRAANATTSPAMNARMVEESTGGMANTAVAQPNLTASSTGPSASR